MRARTSEAGITLMEVLVAIAVLGILVKLALPSLAGSSRRATGDSEVNGFMTELRMRQEQYQLENGRYLSTGGSETVMFPATRSPQPQVLGTLPTSWQQLRVQPPDVGLRCSYVAIAGQGAAGAGATATTSFGFSPPAAAWYYILAHCDLDGDSSLDSFYFTSSTDSSIKKINPGK
jgi:prepilin-type N-terminal cleavage/methylation domain-containing protein